MLFVIFGVLVMCLSMHCWDEPDILEVVAIPQWLTLFRGV